MNMFFRCLTKNSSAVIELEFERPVCLELYKDNKELGRFMLRSSGHTIAAGLTEGVRISKGKKSDLDSSRFLCIIIPRRSWRDIVLASSIHSVRPSRTISQYLLVRFNSFLVQMISTMVSRYPISLVKIDPLTLELLPLFKYRQL